MTRRRTTATSAFIDAGEAFHVDIGVAGGNQHLDSVAFEQREHRHLTFLPVKIPACPPVFEPIVVKSSP